MNFSLNSAFAEAHSFDVLGSHVIYFEGLGNFSFGFFFFDPQDLFARLARSGDCSCLVHNTTESLPRSFCEGCCAFS